VNPSDAVAGLAITPEPTEIEAIAIVAAYEALWPKPMFAAARPARTTSAWRFSGRWWAQPLTRHTRR
jgi:hypothetical protein